MIASPRDSASASGRNCALARPRQETVRINGASCAGVVRSETVYGEARFTLASGEPGLGALGESVYLKAEGRVIGRYAVVIWDYRQWNEGFSRGSSRYRATDGGAQVECFR